MFSKMIKKLRQNSVGIFLVILLCVLFSTHLVVAATTGFSGTAKPGWGNKLSSVVKDSETSTSFVSCIATDRAGDFYLLFRIFDSTSGKYSPTVKIPKTGSGTWTTKLTDGASCHLYAGREYFYDPDTYIIGDWEP